MSDVQKPAAAAAAPANKPETIGQELGNLLKEGWGVVEGDLINAEQNVVNAVKDTIAKIWAKASPELISFVQGTLGAIADQIKKGNFSFDQIETLILNAAQSKGIPLIETLGSWGLKALIAAVVAAL